MCAYNCILKRATYLIIILESKWLFGSINRTVSIITNFYNVAIEACAACESLHMR